MKNQDFSHKVFTAVTIFFFLRVILILIYSSNILSDFIQSLLLFFILLVLIQWNDSAKNSPAGDGNVTIEDSMFFKIQQKFRELAEQYEEKKDYVKAAQIYMKLLKSPYEAAQVFERGHLYNEAAVLYHKKLNNLEKAAECYEKGMNYQSAITLYLSLNEHEKLGDLYTKLRKSSEAKKHYDILVDDYKNKTQYVDAAAVLKNKLGQLAEAQNLLLFGWKSDHDGKNCLHTYFSNITDEDVLNAEVQSIYQNFCNPHQRLAYLEQMKVERSKSQKLQKTTLEIAYDIISKATPSNKRVIDQLVYFKPDDQLVKKDVVKYKINRT